MKFQVFFACALFAIGSSQDTRSGHSWPTPEIIANAGYPAEIHQVTTEDCYILELHRIPRGKNESTLECAAQKKPSVLIQHGLLCSSADWVMPDPPKALGFILADAGYDVWLGNFRGNTYSRKHCTIPPSDYEFWKFTWDQMGRYDIPAMIDKIISVTGNEKVHFIGHSMGTTSVMAMLNVRPEMADKLLLSNFLAPVAYVYHSKSPIRYIAPYIDSVEWIADFLGIGEFLPSHWIIDILDNLFCNPGSLQGICKNILFIICGFDEEQMNKTLLPTILHHTPAGTSTNTIIHYVREMKEKGFFGFDWGVEDNLIIHGTPEPPVYNLADVHTPIALYWSQNDWLAQPADVIEVLTKLPDIYDNYKVPFEQWNHLDFLWGIDADKLLFNRVVENLKKFDQEHNNSTKLS